MVCYATKVTNWRYQEPSQALGLPTQPPEDHIPPIPELPNQLQKRRFSPEVALRPHPHYCNAPCSVHLSPRLGAAGAQGRLLTCFVTPALGTGRGPEQLNKQRSQSNVQTVTLPWLLRCILRA